MKIEKNVPIPPLKGGRGRPLKYPWDKLEVGDMLRVPVKGTTHFNVNQSALSWAKRNGVKFVCRTVGDDLCVWRVQ